MFGFFSKKEEAVDVEQQAATSFSPVTLSTKSLAKDLSQLAAKHKVAANSLDFDILSYKTFCKCGYDEPYKEISKEESLTLFTKEKLQSSEFELYQELQVKVFLKEDTAPAFKIDMAANKQMTHIRVKISTLESVEFEESLTETLYAQIDKKKAKAGLLLGFCDEAIHKGVRQVVSAIRVNGILEEAMTFDVCRGIDLIPVGGEKVLYHYREGKSGEGVEQALMKGVKSGEVVLEVIKQSPGENGRNCKGKLLVEEQVELSSVMAAIKVKEEEFEIQESETSLLYIAKIDGYVQEEPEHTFAIKDTYVVDSMSLKSTGSIDVGQDKDIKITVEQNDSITDAVGIGVKIDTSEIKVAGNVASGAEIIANDVEIEGQTHQTATIKASKAKIHLHKGYVEGDEIEVNILEGGKIVGDIVRVNQLFGGTIEAKEVYLGKVLSNAQVTASHHIEIEEIEGSGNKFIIDARVQRGYHEKNDSFDEEMISLESEVKRLTKAVKQQRDKIQQEKDNVDEIKKKMLEFKASGVKPPAAFILKIKDYQERVKTHNSLLKELKDVKMRKTSLQDELHALNSSVYDAKVIHKSVWKEFNEVKYILLDPPIEVSFLAKEGEMLEELTLAANEEGEFNVKRQG